jgi:hypothetical protein
MANVPSSPILVTLVMEALSSSETSVLTRATQHSIPEDAILRFHICLHSHIDSIFLISSLLPFGGGLFKDSSSILDYTVLVDRMSDNS